MRAPSGLELAFFVASVAAVVAGVAALALGRAGARAVDVHVVVDGPRACRTRVDERAVEEIAESAARDARRLLPMLPAHLTLEVDCGADVIPETGENATTSQPATVRWTVDPSRDVAAIVRRELRASLFHELHHLARGQSAPTVTLADAVVAEGLATAFERDFAGADPPWGRAPPDAEALAWTAEVLAASDTGTRDFAPWLSRHPDGRRWIGLRAGTFVVDRAARASGGSSATLVATPTEEILRAARVR